MDSILSDPIDIVCVLKTGGDYDAEYVHKLYRNVSRNISISYKFYCMSDIHIKGINTIELQHDWKTWWSKIEIFRTFRNKTLYLDLDTVLVGNINHLLTFSHSFTGLRGFYRDIFNSGFMAWEGDYSFIYRDFLVVQDKRKGSERIRDHVLGNDQNFISSRLVEHKINWDVWQDLFPNEVVSYKVHCKGKGVPENAKVICFHGKPRPHEIGWRLS